MIVVGQPRGGGDVLVIRYRGTEGTLDANSAGMGSRAVDPAGLSARATAALASSRTGPSGCWEPPPDSCTKADRRARTGLDGQWRADADVSAPAGISRTTSDPWHHPCRGRALGDGKLFGPLAIAGGRPSRRSRESTSLRLDAGGALDPTCGTGECSVLICLRNCRPRPSTDATASSSGSGSGDTHSSAELRIADGSSIQRATLEGRDALSLFGGYPSAVMVKTDRQDRPTTGVEYDTLASPELRQTYESPTTPSFFRFVVGCL